MQPARDLSSYRKHWAERFGTAPFLPMSRAEMDALGWDSCDVIVVTGDAYVDHPSFGMAIIGRVLEAQGFRVGIIAQPDWHSAEPFRRARAHRTCSSASPPGTWTRWSIATPRDRSIRSDDAYTPGGVGGRRPDRSVIVYAQRCREAFGDVPIVIGGIEASLRRIAHYDYWSDKVRRSILRRREGRPARVRQRRAAIVEIAHRLAARRADRARSPTCAARRSRAAAPPDWIEIDSTHLDMPGRIDPPVDPYAMEDGAADAARADRAAPRPQRRTLSSVA